MIKQDAAVVNQRDQAAIPSRRRLLLNLQAVATLSRRHLAELKNQLPRAMMKKIREIRPDVAKRQSLLSTIINDCAECSNNKPRPP